MVFSWASAQFKREVKCEELRDLIPGVCGGIYAKVQIMSRHLRQTLSQRQKSEHMFVPITPTLMKLSECITNILLHMASIKLRVAEINGA